MDNNDKELDNKPLNQTPDDVEEVATAEDIEAFMRERRKAREEKKANTDRENAEGARPDGSNPLEEEYHSEESALDPYLDPDPEIPWVKYEEPVFLSR